MKIQQFKYEKVVTEEKEWELPTETKYYFETHIRRSISVKPLFTTWNKEKYDVDEYVYALNIVCLHQSGEAKIETYNISVNRINEFYHSEIYEREKSILTFLIDHADEDCDGRTKEQFLADYNNCLTSIQNFL